MLKHAGRAGFVLLLGASVAGCAISQITSPFRSDSKRATAPPTISEERLLEAAKTDTSGQVNMPSPAAGCPGFRVWPRDKMLTIYEIGRVGDGLAIRHRGEITKTARECQLSPGKVSIKYGFAGRVLLGPRGTAGNITLPLKIHVTDHTRNIITTEPLKLAVSVPPDRPVGYFSTVREISFKLQTGARPGDYTVFIAFDRSAPGAG